MGRNRVIYQSEAIYVSKNVASTGSGDHAQLRRVQSANYNFSIERQDVNQFGQLARIDALVLASPTVSLDLSYYPNDGFNEKALGFYVQNNTLGSTAEGNFASGQMGNSSGQNFYIITADEGNDLNTASTPAPLSGKKTISIGNAFLSNYTFEASVGNLPTASVTLEGLNVRSSVISGGTGAIVGGANNTGNLLPSGNNPSVNPELGSLLAIGGPVELSRPIEATGNTFGPSALRPGDITIDFGGYTGTNTTGAPLSVSTSNTDPFHIQSFSLNLPLSRSPIERLGSKFAFARVVDFPIVATFNVNAVVNEIQARNLSEMLDDNGKRTITVSIKKPGGEAGNALVWQFKGSQLQSESFSSSIGANKTVDLVFQTQIGGPSDTNNGIYLSGSFSGIGNIQANQNWGYF